MVSKETRGRVRWAARADLDDDVVPLVLVRDAELLEEEVRRLADDHRRHELAAEPGASACGDEGPSVMGVLWGKGKAGRRQQTHRERRRPR